MEESAAAATASDPLPDSSLENEEAPLGDYATQDAFNNAMAAHHQCHHEEAHMREHDDTILEGGISPPGTPVLKPLNPPQSVPVLDGIGGDCTDVDGLSFLPASSSQEDPSHSTDMASAVSRGNSALRVGHTRPPVKGSQSVIGNTLTSGMRPPIRRYRRCLSGDDAAVESFGSNEIDRSGGGSSNKDGSGESNASVDARSQVQLGDPSVFSSSPISVAEDGSVLGQPSGDACQVDSAQVVRSLARQANMRPDASSLHTAQNCLKNPATATAMAGKHVTRCRRSKSIDRRLNEAAQFAEAVGEVPPTNEDEILGVIIQEDSSSDDDDDDDEGTVVDASEAADTLPSTTPSLTPHRNGGAILIRDEKPLSTRDPSSFAEEEEDTKTASFAQHLDLSRSSARSSRNAITGLDDDPPSSEVAVCDGRDRKVPNEQCVAEVKRPWLCKRFDWPPRQQGATNHHLSLLSYAPEGDNDGGFNSSSSGLFQRGKPFAYRGIHANPPEITKRGISRGNYAQLHRKAWLEVSDKYHRYGKNLRLYYKHWESLDHPTNMFFDWLDSKGEAAGQPLPNLPECPRFDLDSDTVLYITNPDLQARYALDIVPERDGNGSGGILVDSDGDPVRTGPEGWIFILRDHVLYGAQKVTSIAGKSKQRFHHSSFFGGKAVAAAGILITDDSGHLKRLYPHSGHYRPGEAHMQRMLFFLQQGGVDLNTFDVDLQQILHVSRSVKDANTPTGGVVAEADDRGGGATKKAKKVDSLHLKPALYVACFLAHKARMIGEGIFTQIHKIRAIGAATVNEALDGVDEGGFWK